MVEVFAPYVLQARTKMRRIREHAKRAGQASILSQKVQQQNPHASSVKQENTQLRLVQQQNPRARHVPHIRLRRQAAKVSSTACVTRDQKKSVSSACCARQASTK
jgi:hypothetical protein